MTDLFLRAERTYHLAVELDLSVAHLVEAITALLAGRLEDAHWELWRGDWTREVPGEMALAVPRKQRKRRAA